MFTIYISIKNILSALKLIYLAPLSQTIYKLTHETKNEKIYQIIHCLTVPKISRETFSYTFGQFTNPDNKENLQNNSHIQ